MVVELKQCFNSRGTLVAACIAGAALTLTVAAGAARADQRKIYLNGIDLTNVDVTEQSFKGCDVRFDANGNLHITVKGLEMTTVEQGDGAKKKTSKTTTSDGDADDAKKVKKVKKSELGTAPGTYYLIAKPEARKGHTTPYKVSVYINDTLVKLVQPDGGMVVMDISKYVGPGLNTARLIAAHTLSKADKDTPTIDDTLEIVIGRGEVKKGTVVIRAAYVEYSRNGAETKDFDDKFKFEVKRK